MAVESGLPNVFGTIMAGSGTRFKGGSQQDTQTQANFDRAKTSPEAFSGLRAGPEFTIEYEAATALPVDGSDKLLRQLSPFMIQVEPPKVYGELGNLNTGSKRDPGLIVDSAYGLVNPYASARSHLQSMPLGMDHAQSQRAGEQSVSTNASRVQARGGTGQEPTDEQGRGSRRLGTPSIADMRTAVDIANQIKAAVQTPPLILLINPQSLSLNLTKIQQFTDRTRRGYVFHAWGMEQPTLSVETRCGAFYSAGRGVQWASRRDSASWNNLMALFQLYKNNGYIYDTVGQSNAHHLVGALSIHYDGWIYYGSMGSFSWTFEEGTPNGGINVSLEFTVSWMVDTSPVTTNVQPMRPLSANPTDPRFMGNRNQRIQTYPVGADGSPNTVIRQEPTGYQGLPNGSVLVPPSLLPTVRVSAPAGAGNFSVSTVEEQVPQLSARPPVPFSYGG